MAVNQGRRARRRVRRSRQPPSIGGAASISVSMRAEQSVLLKKAASHAGDITMQRFLREILMLGVESWSKTQYPDLYEEIQVMKEISSKLDRPEIVDQESAE